MLQAALSRESGLLALAEFYNVENDVVRPVLQTHASRVESLLQLTPTEQDDGIIIIIF